MSYRHKICKYLQTSYHFLIVFIQTKCFYSLLIIKGTLQLKSEKNQIHPLAEFSEFEFKHYFIQGHLYMHNNSSESLFFFSYFFNMSPFVERLTNNTFPLTRKWESPLQMKRKSNFWPSMHFNRKTKLKSDSNISCKMLWQTKPHNILFC